MPPGGCNAFLALRSLTLAAVTQNLPVLQCRAVVPPRMQQSAAAQCSCSSVVQQSRVQPAAAAAAGLRPRCRVRLVAAAAHFAASEARLGWVWPLWPQTEAAGGLHCIPPAATAGLQPLLQCTTQHAPLLCCTGWPPTVEVYVLILGNPKGRHTGTEHNNLPC